MSAPVKKALAWCGVWSAAAFCAMGLDKRRARRGGRRIPEKTLFFLAAIGGSAGATAGMYVFRHKTRHWYFRFGFPAILAAQAALAAWLFRTFA